MKGLVAAEPQTPEEALNEEATWGVLLQEIIVLRLNNPTRGICRKSVVVQFAFNGKRKVPHPYSRAEENARSLTGFDFITMTAPHEAPSKLEFDENQDSE